MINEESVFLHIKETADIDPEEEGRLLPFCSAAAAEISSRRRPEADETDIRLVAAAAACAYCDYLLMKNASETGLGSFKAGDVTVSRDGGKTIQAVEKLKKTALAEAAQLLSDREFHFGTM